MYCYFLIKKLNTHTHTQGQGHLCIICLSNTFDYYLNTQKHYVNAAVLFIRTMLVVQVWCLYTKCQLEGKKIPVLGYPGTPIFNWLLKLFLHFLYPRSRQLKFWYQCLWLWNTFPTQPKRSRKTAREGETSSCHPRIIQFLSFFSKLFPWSKKPTLSKDPHKPLRYTLNYWLHVIG